MGQETSKMNKSFIYQKIRSIFSALKPWILAILFVVILRFTGALSGISFIAQSAIMEIGLMNFDPERNVTRGAFDYNFSIKDLKGNTLDFNQLKGKVIFLNLWATWCGPCRVEMPSIQNLYNTTDHEKVAFVMLSLDTRENHHKVVKYVHDKQFSFPVYVPDDLSDQLKNVPSIPTTLIIGKDGKIKSKKVGTANYDTDKFRKFLNDLTGD
jgi:thiol-disulfide isomerase/thioredoxin